MIIARAACVLLPEHRAEKRPGYEVIAELVQRLQGLRQAGLPGHRVAAADAGGGGRRGQEADAEGDRPHQPTAVRRLRSLPVGLQDAGDGGGGVMSHPRGNIFLAGVGGQGILLASEVLGEAFLRGGYDVKKSEVHGMAQRGGAVTTHLRFGPKVYSPLIEPGTADLLHRLREDGGAALHPLSRAGRRRSWSTRQEIPPAPVSSGQERYPERIEERLRDTTPRVHLVDALTAALALHEVRAVNMVMTGAASHFLPLPEEAYLEALEEPLAGPSRGGERSGVPGRPRAGAAQRAERVSRGVDGSSDERTCAWRRPMIWNDEFETLPREALEALQLKRLRDLVDRVYATVPFYRQKLDGGRVQARRHPDAERSCPPALHHQGRPPRQLPLRPVRRAHGAGRPDPRLVRDHRQADRGGLHPARHRHLVGADGPHALLRRAPPAATSSTTPTATASSPAAWARTTAPEKLGAPRHPHVRRQHQAADPDHAGLRLHHPAQHAVLRPEPRRGDGASDGRRARPRFELQVRHLRRRALDRGDAARRSSGSSSINALDIYGLSEVIGPGVAIGVHRGEARAARLRGPLHPRDHRPRHRRRCCRTAKPGELVFTTLTKEAFPVIRYRTRDISRLIPDALRLRPDTPPDGAHLGPHATTC
ncbi:MAG: 2-oxoacid:acceptor oxidoreductase family protein [Candidatus Moduliflexus flocculans]|nr:2-oxoacid:acceptor oxidoreductase family protein [Candidatus Moduliflexus flocculans]